MEGYEKPPFPVENGGDILKAFEDDGISFVYD